LRQITSGGANNLEAAWSPDGARLAFISERDGNKESYVMDSHGTNHRRLTTNPDVDDDPGWSSDGKWLAFESKREGRMDVYKMQADGSDPVRLTRDGVQAIWITSLDESQTPRRLSPGDGFDAAWSRR
jgi:TolB protein